jgi:pathogenesis-related protein 1
MMLVLFTALAWAAPTLDVVGQCPGAVDVLITDASPNGTIALLSGTPTRSGTLPGGPCAGAPTGLSRPTLRQLRTLGPSGWAVVSLNLPAAACTQALEVLDVGTCASSPAVRIVDPDRDGDGYQNPEAGGQDCDDDDPSINPGAPEWPGNLIDDDCNPNTPDELDCAYDPDPALSLGEPPVLAGMTALHNEVRSRLGQAPLQWNPALAVSAQRWADQCGTGLDPNRSPDAGFAYVAQNLAFGSGAAVTPLWLAELWIAESEDYLVGTPISQSTLQVCGHYTQLVWSSTSAIGCGYAWCANRGVYNLVCNYGAGGNYLGQVPFTCGTDPCHDCDFDGALQTDDADDDDPTVQ